MCQVALLGTCLPASASWIESLLLSAACCCLGLGALCSYRVLMEAPPAALPGFPQCWLCHVPSLGALHIPALLPLKLYSSTELSQTAASRSSWKTDDSLSLESLAGPTAAGQGVSGLFCVKSHVCLSPALQQYFCGCK